MSAQTKQKKARGNIFFQNFREGKNIPFLITTVLK